MLTRSHRSIRQCCNSMQVKRQRRGSRAFRRRGFTLVELMVAVVIVGILASIAIPNFLRYMAKAKQAEARTNLKTIYIAESGYFLENDTYTNDFAALGWEVTDAARHSYDLGGDIAGKSNGGASQCPFPTGVTTTLFFRAEACGNIDADDVIDRWHMYHNQNLVLITDDAASC